MNEIRSLFIELGIISDLTSHYVKIRNHKVTKLVILVINVSAIAAVIIFGVLASIAMNLTFVGIFESIWFLIIKLSNEKYRSLFEIIFKDMYAAANGKIYIYETGNYILNKDTLIGNLYSWMLMISIILFSFLPFVVGILSTGIIAFSIVILGILECSSFEILKFIRKEILMFQEGPEKE